MSGRATGWVGRFGPHPDDIDRDGKPYGARARGLRSALLAVADAADVNGRHAHPGVENVAEFSLYSFGQARRLLSDLVAEGWLNITESGGGRGLATVFDLVTDPSNRHLETRASCAALSEGNARTGDPKRAHGDAKRAHPEARPTVATVEPSTVKTLSLTLDDATPPESSFTFDDFWGAYPRKTGKATARRAWDTATRKHPPGSIMGGLAANLPDLRSRAPQFVPHAATWLNGERWHDEPVTATSGRQGPAPVSYPNTERAEFAHIDPFAHKRKAEG